MSSEAMSYHVETITSFVNEGRVNDTPDVTISFSQGNNSQGNPMTIMTTSIRVASTEQPRVRTKIGVDLTGSTDSDSDTIIHDQQEEKREETSPPLTTDDKPPAYVGNGTYLEDSPTMPRLIDMSEEDIPVAPTTLPTLDIRVTFCNTCITT